MTLSFISILRRLEFVNSSVDNIRVLNWFQFPLERNAEIFTVTPSLTPSTTSSALLPVHLFMLSVFLPSLRLTRPASLELGRGNSSQNTPEYNPQFSAKLQLAKTTPMVRHRGSRREEPIKNTTLVCKSNNLEVPGGLRAHSKAGRDPTLKILIIMK